MDPKDQIVLRTSYMDGPLGQLEYLFSARLLSLSKRGSLNFKLRKETRERHV